MMSPQRKHAKRRNKEARHRKRSGLVILGYKGAEFETAAFYAPYVPLQMIGVQPALITEVTNKPGRWIWKMPKTLRGDLEPEVNAAITWAYENVQPGGWTLETDRYNPAIFYLEIERKEDAVLFKMFVT